MPDTGPVVTADPPIRHLVLVGLMGTGKTSVARHAASALGWRVTDSDPWIHAREGATAREIRAARGTEALHELERRHLLEALESRDPTVVCAAASTIEDPTCRAALLAPGVLVAWLTARPETAAARFDREAHRPRYGDDTAAFLARQARARAPWFREVADVELATDDAPPEALAGTLVRAVRAAATGSA